MFWCPYKIHAGDLKEIEKIQERATKLVIKLKSESYTDKITNNVYIIQGGPKKPGRRLMTTILSNLNRFKKRFHRKISG